MPDLPNLVASIQKALPEPLSQDLYQFIGNIISANFLRLPVEKRNVLYELGKYIAYLGNIQTKDKLLNHELEEYNFISFLFHKGVIENKKYEGLREIFDNPSTIIEFTKHYEKTYPEFNFERKISDEDEIFQLFILFLLALEQYEWVERSLKLSSHNTQILEQTLKCLQDVSAFDNVPEKLTTQVKQHIDKVKKLRLALELSQFLQ
jgi:hypothetical protein